MDSVSGPAPISVILAVFPVHPLADLSDLESHSLTTLSRDARVELLNEGSPNIYALARLLNELMSPTSERIFHVSNLHSLRETLVRNNWRIRLKLAEATAVLFE